jgi:nucleoside-diphosphate-sugar epimerase
MHIAVLGATSQIARDLAPRLLQAGHVLSLFARSPERLAFLEAEDRCMAATFDSFPRGAFDAVINCVGVGDPARATAMGADILQVTATYDDLALEYVRHQPNCRYIFLSSGAVYGSTFEVPVDEGTPTSFPLNHLRDEHWYGLSKFAAEVRHRAHASLAIVDLRVFSYVSHTQNLGARFLLTDMLRAIRDRVTLMTSTDYIVRDFVHPSDLHALVEAVLISPPANTPIDVYTKNPVDKPALLEAMRDRFGLQYELQTRAQGVNATGTKPHYYSQSRRARAFGYQPQLSALDGVLQEAELALHAA